ncbi:hypothetical protein, partial [Vibrio parahaemolyticus]|uniref:hypothetical protein n=1 Tax=Vibrio parahaemolyticus TaxID=670 RepID=UPI00301CFCCE
HLVWDQRVGGSNPSSPTTFKEAAAEMLRLFAFYAFAFYAFAFEHRVGVWEPSRVESLFTDHF